MSSAWQVEADKVDEGCVEVEVKKASSPSEWAVQSACDSASLSETSTRLPQVSEDKETAEVMLEGDQNLTVGRTEAAGLRKTFRRTEYEILMADEMITRAVKPC